MTKFVLNACTLEARFTDFNIKPNPIGSKNPEQNVIYNTVALDVSSMTLDD